MPTKRNWATEQNVSPLVRRFVERSGFGSGVAPQQVMTRLIETSRHECPRRASIPAQVQQLLKLRNILHISVKDDLECEGLLEPLGSSMRDGFRMLLKGGSESRTQFTMAHEICHTYFYELVPEIKFTRHERDEQEEGLCNFGAATILIPAAQLARRAKPLPVCIQSLEVLAQLFCVSLPTMALRLYALGIWHCDLSIWRHMANGSFVLRRVYGGRSAEWEWENPHQLREAWNAPEDVFGRTMISHVDQRGVHRFRPVSYQLHRSFDGLVALWGPRVQRPTKSLPLFQTRNRDTSAAGQSK